MEDEEEGWDVCSEEHPCGRCLDCLDMSIGDWL